jgi:stearoyl-CoA desaturase (delta-9 desaturase)
MNFTHNQIVRGLQAINHLILLFGLGYVFTTGEYYWLGISVLAYVFTCMLGVNIGYHRLISHRSFQTYDFIEKFFSVLGVLTIIGSPLAWTAIHRQHHRSAETSRDPHSPYILGKFNAWVGLWNKDPLDLKLIRDMRKNKFQKFLHHNYLSIIIAYCIMLALINPLLVIFAFSIPACLSLFSTSAVIVIAHFQGYKTYDLKHDQARNSWVTHVLSLGEGWHNNHHAKPYQWNQGEKWWEFDPPSWIIRLIKK